MTEKLTEKELKEAQSIQESLDTLQLRINHATEKEIATSDDFSELSKEIEIFKDIIEDIYADSQCLDAKIDQRQWEEWNEGK